MISRPDLYQDEKLLSYSKYYYIDPDPLHPLAAQILRKPLEKEDVLWPEDVEKMFSPGYQDAMLGYYLFDGGRLVEQGSHEALLEKNGKYAEMFRLQSEKYRQGEA